MRASNLDIDLTNPDFAFDPSDEEYAEAPVHIAENAQRRDVAAYPLP